MSHYQYSHILILSVSVLAYNNTFNTSTSHLTIILTVEDHLPFLFVIDPSKTWNCFAEIPGTGKTQIPTHHI